jgi:hypothetical protein
MPSVPGVDHPEEHSEAEVALTGHGVSVSTRVEQVGGGVLTVRPSVGEYAEGSVATTGDRVEVYWKSGEETRVLPAEVLSAQEGAAPRWQMQITGISQVAQRRQAVRGRVALPVVIGHGSLELTGESVDFSEGGLRVTCEGFGVPPEPGATLDVFIGLEDGSLTARGEVVRLQTRGARWLLSIHLLDLPEREGDRLRRRVFQVLREERARLAR